MKLYIYTNEIDYQVYLANTGINVNSVLGRNNLYTGLSTLNNYNVLLFTSFLRKEKVEKYCSHNNIMPICLELDSEDIISSNNKITIINNNYEVREDYASSLSENDLCVSLDYFIPMIYINNVYKEKKKNVDSAFQNVPNYFYKNLIKTLEYSKKDVDIDKIKNLYKPNNENNNSSYIDNIRAGYLLLFEAVNIRQDKLIGVNERETDKDLECIKAFINYRIKYFNLLFDKVSNKDKILFQNIDIILNDILNKTNNLKIDKKLKVSDKFNILIFRVLVECALKNGEKYKDEFLKHFISLFRKYYKLLDIDSEKEFIQFINLFNRIPTVRFMDLMKAIDRKSEYRSFKILYIIYINLDSKFDYFKGNLDNYNFNKTDYVLTMFIYGLLKGIILLPRYLKQDPVLFILLTNKINKLSKDTIKYNILSVDELSNKFKTSFIYSYIEYLLIMNNSEFSYNALSKLEATHKLDIDTLDNKYSKLIETETNDKEKHKLEEKKKSEIKKLSKDFESQMDEIVKYKDKFLEKIEKLKEFLKSEVNGDA